MKRNSFVSLAFLLLAAPPVYSQIQSVLVTGNASANISGGNPATKPCSSADCSVVNTVSSEYFNTEMSASKTMVSGRMARLTNYANLQGNGSASSNVDVYAKVPLNQEVYVKAPATVRANWVNNQNNIGYQSNTSVILYNNSYGVNDSTSAGVTPASGVTGGASGAKVLKVLSSGVGTPLVVGSDTYYLVGHIALSGAINLMAYNGANPSFDFNGAIGGVEVSYNGKVLKYEAGDMQPGVVAQQLPNDLAVKVVQDDTSAAKSGESVVFTVLDPVNGATLSAATVLTGTDGIARTKLKLGTIAGQYRVNATCPGCVAPMRTYIFTATAKDGKEVAALSGEICNLTGQISGVFKNPFRVFVYNTLTGAREPGYSIHYSIAGLVDKSGNTQSNTHGADPSVKDSVTDTDGYSRSYLKAGSVEGTYLMRVNCPDCQAGQEVICRGTAFAFNLGSNPEVEPTVGANPYDKDPETGKAVTPVLRITKIDYPNPGKSFTTYPGSENKIHLEAELLPKEEFVDQGIIKWSAIDYPGDLMASGSPYMPTGDSGAQKDMYIVLDGINVPLAENDGRSGPLTYSVGATAVTSAGKTITSRKKILKQDEIDKCRQEYIDVSKLGEDLTEMKYFLRYLRNDFTKGVDGAIDSDYVKFVDCYAHIYPDRAQEVEALRSQVSFLIDVTSGYRSPRKNRLQRPTPGVWNSEHQFGGGVDIVPKVITDKDRAEKFKALWDNTVCPKILETGAAKVMAVCKTGEATPRYKEAEGYTELNVFGQANCLHLGD
jgi:uncharacterized protein YcbK (DUF882 family)